MADPVVLDQWSGLDHKDLTGVEVAPPYAEGDARRLNHYAALGAYLETTARSLLPDDSIHEPEELQEFGEAAVLVDRVAAAVLGEDPAVIVVGADEAVPARPELEDAPDEPSEDLPDHERDVEAQIFETAVEVWTANAEASIEAWRAQLEELPRLRARQGWLQEWEVRERFLAKLRENENENVVPLGDGVMTLGWDQRAGRVRMRLYEPDAYFPVLESDDPEEFPDVVHISWQYSTFEGDEETRWVRRVTYRMVPVEEFEGEWTPARYLGEGETQTHICTITDGSFLLEDLEDIYTDDRPPQLEEIDISDGTGEPELVPVDNLSLNIDFMPVVHVPNTPSTSKHFGRSVLSRLGQLLDEIAATDTDEAMSSRWAARPPLVVDGLDRGTEVVNLSPGESMAGGGVDTIEMAPNLEKIGLRLNSLLKRLSVNGQVPEGLLGRVDASEVPSGLALTLSFTPFVQLIGNLREARSAKFPLLLRMVQRIAIQSEDETLGGDVRVYDAEVAFGAFMPQDLVGVVDLIVKLLQVDAISVRTALIMLVENGVPIESIEAEIAEIRSTDGATALAIADALQDARPAADYLGIKGFEAAGPDPEGDAIPAIGAVQQ